MTGNHQLTGIRVLDLSRVLAGPWACQMLADLGAEVIKVERPEVGDDARYYAPPFLEATDGSGRTEAAFFLCTNRGKKSVTLDLSCARGQEIVRDLAARCDVVVENFRVGTMQRYGLDYPSLSALNPRLIYCSITGYGQTGPYRDRPGYDAVFQAMGGLMSSIGYPEDVPGSEPMRTGLSITDVMTGLYADIAILGALYARDARGGEGEYIDLSLLDSSIAVMSHYAQFYLTSGRVPPRRGNGGNGGVPSQVFKGSEGSLILTTGNDAQFRRLCDVLGRPDIAKDVRYRRTVDRIRNRDALLPVIEALFATRPAAEWLEKLVAADIPAGPINDLAAVFADPHVRSRGMAVTLPHPLGVEAELVANPIRYAKAPITYDLPPPLLGQHTEEVLRDLAGLTPDQIRSLREDRVI